MGQKKNSPQKLAHKGRCLCQCLRKYDPEQLFRDNTRDIMNTLVEVLLICSIHECKAMAAREVIRNAFKHYDDMRHRTNDTPRTSLKKEHLIFELGRKCMMTHIEAELTYSIMKRAFKAFYFGTSDLGIRNPILEAQLIHSQESVWIHAAKRTARIYAEYEGIFFPVQKKFEERIRTLYKQLFENMRNRASPVILESCCCENCVKQIVPTSASNDKLSDTSSNNEISNGEKEKKEGILREKFEVTNEKQSKFQNLKEVEVVQNMDKLQRCLQCKNPKIICTCLVDNVTGVLNYPCTQGPFKVRWILEEGAYKPDPCITKPRNHECPIDCDELSEMTISQEDESNTCDCECDLSEEEAQKIEMNDDETDDQASTELSDTRTVYSFHMPIPDYTPVMLEDKNMCPNQKIEITKVNRKAEQTKCKPIIVRTTDNICKSLAKTDNSKSCVSSRLLSGDSGTKSSEKFNFGKHSSNIIKNPDDQLPPIATKTSKADSIIDILEPKPLALISESMIKEEPIREATDTEKGGFEDLTNVKNLKLNKAGLSATEKLKNERNAEYISALKQNQSSLKKTKNVTKNMTKSKKAQTTSAHNDGKNVGRKKPTKKAQAVTEKKRVTFRTDKKRYCIHKKKRPKVCIEDCQS